MPNDTSTLDLDGKSCYNDLHKAPVSKDTTLVLTLSEEKLVKRIRQLSDGMLTLVFVKGSPLMLVFNGKTEFLEKLS